MTQKGRSPFRWMLLAFVCILFLGSTQQSQAQLDLTLKRVINNWPTIELYFTVSCDGDPQYFFNKEQHFKVYENGIEVGQFTLWCPDPRKRCAISVALVFDASGSMSGGGQSGAIAAGRAFVDLMDGILDEAAIIWFNTAVNVQLAMTTNKPALLDAVNSLPAGGGTAVWDGIYNGIQELIGGGSNPCRAVIAMTDGGDNASTRSPGEIIALANRNRIRVFTIGLGSSVQSAQLSLIADLTGGQYYNSPSPSQLVNIYTEISTIIFKGFLECLITYQAECMDGSTRNVELVIQNFCNGRTDSDTKGYRAPRDTSTFDPLSIAIGKREEKGDQDVRVPLELITPINPEDWFHSSTFTVMFDPSCVSFVNIEAKQGDILYDVPLLWNPVTGGVEFRIDESIRLSGNGQLAELIFHTSDPDDTTCCEIELSSWVFDAGCFKPVLENGEICIIPRKPNVHCELRRIPSELFWVRSAKDYQPNPFDFVSRVINTGDKEATNVQFKIDVDPADFDVVAPISGLQAGNPLNCPPLGAEPSEASWQLRALPRLSGDSVEICVTASFDNHPDVTCCQKVWIPPTEPILECTVTAPDIQPIQSELRYDPMPFTVTVDVLNRGGMETDTVFATIIVPADLELAGPDAPDNNTKILNPKKLLPFGTGSVSWQVSHPITTTEENYEIVVWVKTSNSDSTKCSYLIRIPPLQAPSLRAQCVTPDELDLHESAGTYTPNPFDVTLNIVNYGGMTAENVTARLILPDDVELVDAPSTPLMQVVGSGTIEPFKPSDTPIQLTWKVRYTELKRNDRYLDFNWVVGGTSPDPPGLDLDTARAFCRVFVPGLPPAFECDLLGPDSLILNATETGVISNLPEFGVAVNEFQVTYKIRNVSAQTAKVQRAEIYYAVGDDIQLQPPPNNSVTVDKELGPNQETEITWTFSVKNRISRRFIEIVVIALDDENNQIRCNHRMPIQALKTALVCNTNPSDGRITYRTIERDYDPQEFTVTTDLINAGGANLTNVGAKISIVNPGGMPDLVEFDPDFTGDNTNPRTVAVMFPGAANQKTFEWGFRLANDNNSGVPQPVEFRVDFWSDQTPLIENSCNTVVIIDPVLTPQLVCELETEDTIFFNINKYEPTPFNVHLRVQNIGNGDARNVEAYVLQDERFSIKSGTPSSLQLGTILAGDALNFGDNNGFFVEVNPRETDGIDMISVVVVADGIPPARCDVPVFVQKELGPVFEITCVANPSALIFNEDVNDYVPNPFEVVTMVTNVGTARSINTKIVFDGPARFTPQGQISEQSIGTLEVNETKSFTWSMRALRRDVGGQDYMNFKVLGYGGLGDKLVTKPCESPIIVPPARAAEYEITCESPAELTYDGSTGTYLPDPFVFKATITNNGEADGRGIYVTAELQTSEVQLAPGVDAVQYIDLLPQGQSKELTWLVRPVTTKTEITTEMCASLVDTFMTKAKCCSETKIPPATDALLHLACHPQFDVLIVDPQHGDYENSPFEVYLTVTNTGQRQANNVWANLRPLYNSELNVIGEDDKLVAITLDPSQTSPEFAWTVNAKPRTQSGPLQMIFTVTADDLPLSTCVVEIEVPEVGRPSLDCQLSFDPYADLWMDGDDSYLLEFDETIGDYEGYSSPNGDYNVFDVVAVVQNVGDAQANRLKATVIPPPGVTLDMPEAVIDLENIGPNGQTQVSFRYRVLRQAETADRLFKIRITADNAASTECSQTITIEGAPKAVTATIPMDPVGQFGQKIQVPVYIDETIGKDLSVYKLNVKYDPTVVSFISATNEGTKTQIGWNGPRVKPLGDGVLRIEDFTTGSPLASKTGGVLVYLIFEGVFGNDGDEELAYATSDLDLIEEPVDYEGQTYVSSMNSVLDDDLGDIDVILVDGMVTVSGECIVPLNSSLKFELAQNIPNPFNPTTTIDYKVGVDTHVKIIVYDALGRAVRTLVDEYQEAGEHSVLFDATSLTSGTYIYQIETTEFTDMKRMVLTR